MDYNILTYHPATMITLRTFLWLTRLFSPFTMETPLLISPMVHGTFRAMECTLYLSILTLVSTILATKKNFRLQLGRLLPQGPSWAKARNI